MTADKRQKRQLGGVYAVPLPDGRFAFVRAYQDVSYGVFDWVTPKLPSLDEIASKPILFFHAGNDRAIKTGLWPFMGHLPFPNDDAAHAPPVAVYYVPSTREWTVNGRPHVEDRGQIREATVSEVEGLDYMVVSQRPEDFVRVVVDRLVKGNHDHYRVHVK